MRIKDTRQISIVDIRKYIEFLVLFIHFVTNLRTTHVNTPRILLYVTVFCAADSIARNVFQVAIANIVMGRHIEKFTYY